MITVTPLSLSELALKYTTDKGTVPFKGSDGNPTYVHCYTDIYDKVLSPRRLQPLNILDIGAWGANRGGSTLMWREFFPNAHIYALDVCADVMNLANEERITPIHADLDDEASAEAKIAALAAKFDVVFEDASHHPKQQSRTLYWLSRYLAPQYHYFIEDIAAGGRREIVDAVQRGEPFPFLSPEEWKELTGRVKKITISKTAPSSILFDVTG